MHRIFAVLSLGVLTVLLPGCSLICGQEEERAVSVGSDSVVVYTRAGADSPTRLRLDGRVTEFEAGRSGFEDLFRVIDDDVDRDGVVLPLQGQDPTTGERVALYLALPTPLRRGTSIPVGGAFPVALSSDVREGARPRKLADPGRAEVSFRTGTYHFPPAEYRTTYLATTAGGTLRVVDRGGEYVTLELDVSLADAGGRAARLQGRVTAQAERYTPPCT